MKLKKTITTGNFPYAPITNPYQQLFTSAIEYSGVKVIRIPPVKWYPLQTAANADCDILHLDWPHDWYNGKNALTRSIKTWMYRQGLKQLRKKTVIWTAHNLGAHDAPNPQREHQMIQELINQCQGVMVMSEASRQLLCTNYRIPEHVDVRRIYHGHYIDFYKNEVTRQEARKELGITSDEFVYLVPGAIKPYKGHAEAICAFQSVSTRSDTLLIAGGGNASFIDDLRTLAKTKSRQESGNVRFIQGFIAEDNLQNYYNAADVTLLPFRQVLNSGSLLLAMSFGSPVIAPSIGSIPEIAMPEYYFGYEHNCNIEIMLKDTLVKAKTALDKELLKSKINNAIISFVRSKYDWQKIGQQLHDWYRELL